MRIFLATTLALSTATAAISFPALAQGSSEALRQLDAQLPGTLISDPTRIDWESYGADMEASSIVDEAIPGGGAARQFTIKRADEFIYAAGTNIPLTKNLKRGEQVTVGFYARTLEADTEDGKGILRVRFQQDTVPYPGFGEQTLTIGTEWEWYEVTAEAERGLRTKDGIIAVQFGRTRQTLQIGQAIVVSGASAIAASTPVQSAPAQPARPVAELAPQLQGVGKLINDPSKGDWQFTGGVDSWKPMENAVLWGTAASRVTTESQAEGSPSIAARIPIHQRLEEGDELVVAIAARTESASDNDGRALLQVRIQDRRPPHESFAENAVGFGENWQLIRIRTKAPRVFFEGTAELLLTISEAGQVLDLGPVYVLKVE